VEYNDGMVAHDENMARMLAKLDELDIAEDTIVMYLTDTAPHYNSWQDARITLFRSEKNTNWVRRSDPPTRPRLRITKNPLAKKPRNDGAGKLRPSARHIRLYIRNENDTSFVAADSGQDIRAIPGMLEIYGEKMRTRSTRPGTSTARCFGRVDQIATTSARGIRSGCLVTEFDLLTTSLPPHRIIPLISLSSSLSQ
jgi:hypothetical protein